MVLLILKEFFLCVVSRKIPNISCILVLDALRQERSVCFHYTNINTILYVSSYVFLYLK